jgi:hypothetical protein
MNAFFHSESVTSIYAASFILMVKARRFDKQE